MLVAYLLTCGLRGNAVLRLHVSGLFSTASLRAQHFAQCMQPRLSWDQVSGLCCIQYIFSCQFDWYSRDSHWANCWWLDSRDASRLAIQLLAHVDPIGNLARLRFLGYTGNSEYS